MVAQVVPFCGLHEVRRARNQHVVSLAVQALSQRDHRVHVTTGAEWSEQNFHARSLSRAPAPRPPQSERGYELRGARKISIRRGNHVSREPLAPPRLISKTVLLSRARQ